MELEQEKADEYMQVKKKFKNIKPINLSQPFDRTEILFSDLHGDIFKLDMRQGRIEFKAITMNNRAQDCFVICRLDICDKPHKNPDGEKIIGPHIHFYKEGYGDKFAKPADQCGFSNFDNLIGCINHFLEICNIDSSRISIQEVL